MNDNDETFQTGAQLLASWKCQTREQKLERACMALMHELNELHAKHEGQDLDESVNNEAVSCSCADAYRMGAEAIKVV